ncbi:carbohydrate ABC transporter permease [Polycladomyces subterraneus]|uniref:Sugar ABC transporter permease n=1 Tax=Polycladomyces subterraneus TaxID=1016997 RepID=A0ABT8IPA6_9BACL|nr:sugar ABC transporter permease [Polycladomyces subterraneus]MDN4594618.1 sugar ABC transporter permease [Polycladomyces subterraneus]
MSKEDRLLKWVFVLPALIVIAGLMAYPILYAFGTSFTTYLFGKPASPAGLLNWQYAMEDPLFLHSVGITLGYAVIAIPIELALGVGLALVFRDLESYVPPKWLGVARAVIILPFVIMPTVTGIIWRLILMPQAGLADYLFSLVHLQPVDWLGNGIGAMASVILMDIWMWVPFVFVIVFAGLEALSDEPFEAAKVDGATQWQTFWHVTLPLLKPALLVAVSLRTIDALRIFDQVYAMTQGGPGDATTFVSIQLSKTAFSNLDFGVASAELFLVYVIMLLLVGGYYFVGKVGYRA